MFRQNFACSALLKDFGKVIPVRGYHPLGHIFPDISSLPHQNHWPGPLSLVTTNGVSVDVLSSGYLDISVRRVCFLTDGLTAGLPHSGICGSKSIRNSPQLIAAYYALHRLSTPRHPPNALARRLIVRTQRQQSGKHGGSLIRLLHTISSSGESTPAIVIADDDTPRLHFFGMSFTYLSNSRGSYLSPLFIPLLGG